MIVVGIGELEVAIDLEEPGDRAALVELLVELFGESEYVLSDIATAEEGRVVDLYVEAFTQGGYIDIQQFVNWLSDTVAGITESDACDGFRIRESSRCTHPREATCAGFSCYLRLARPLLLQAYNCFSL